MEAGALLEGLDASQREAVTTDALPLCVLAGPGSGKTRVLTRRIAYRIATGAAAPGHTLALTFTRKAAGELSRRLAALGVRERVAAGTFHAVAYAQLRQRWADQGTAPPALLDRKARLLVPLLAAHTGRRRGLDGRPAALAADVAAEIEWAAARGVAAEQYEAAADAAGRRPPLAPSAMAEVHAAYQREKRRRGLVDFDDLLSACAAALESDPGFAAAQRWRRRHLLVDEFQDVNPLQLRLLEAWRGGRPDLCVVGDPDQAIYGWNGADPSFLSRFAERFPGARVVRLAGNYRSSPQVLAAAGAVLGRPTGAAGSQRAHRPEGPVPTVTAYPTDAEEAVGVARAVRDHHGPRLPWSHLAVLVRTNAQSVLFEEAFRAAGIPYLVRGAGGFLDRPEVRQVLAELRRSAAVPVSSLLDDLAALVDEAAAGSEERRGELEVLVRLGAEYAALDAGGTAGGFAAWLAATLGPDPDHPAGGRVRGSRVEIATFHRAKGLEWPVVFVAGLERGLVPIGHAEGPEARAEERRLLYVALTRAERELHCSWAQRRVVGARTQTRSPSPWLEQVEAARRALLAGGVGEDWRRHLGEGRSRLRAAGGRRVVRVGAGADPAVLAALREWRARTCRRTGVPADLLFHDVTLAALAEARPRTREDLLAVPGLGPLKVERHGEALLAVLAEAGGGAGAAAG